MLSLFSISIDPHDVYPDISNLTVNSPTRISQRIVTAISKIETDAECS
jgi:hypothetical protein